MPQEPTAKEAVRYARLLGNLASKVTTMVKASPKLMVGEDEHIKELLEINLEDETASTKSIPSQAQEKRNDISLLRRRGRNLDQDEDLGEISHQHL